MYIYIRPQTCYRAYPSAESLGLIKGSWLSHKQSWLKESTQEWVLTLTRQQGLSYVQRANDNAFCDAVRSIVQMTKCHRYTVVPERNIWTPPNLCSIARGSVNFRGNLANHHG